ncbi:MAG: hypothetical protein ACE5KY_02695 [Candidatus Tectimicrobiota bacterium]
MPPGRWTVLVAGLVAAAVGWAAETRSTAQQPVLQVGDEWTYAVTANGHYLGKRRFTVAGTATFRGQPALRITSTLVEVRSEKVREFIEDSDLFFTPEGAWIGERRGPGRTDYVEPPLPMTRWPLAVGKRWSATVSFYFELFNLPQEENRFRVVANGPITVPAGTFETFHLERRSRGSTMFYWYAPAVKNIVKYKGVDWHDDLNYVVELVSYRLKP